MRFFVLIDFWSQRVDTEEDWFGTSVAISGDTVVIGAVNHADNGSDSGSAVALSGLRQLF
ncbi:MAG: hypothetical protein DRJ61_15650 [Acidobacteria bacterium]|nr:MAG: hypothetical protein DRJ61_15650 [Acidobacteriota bacterium]